MNQSPSTVIRRDDIAYILAALTLARPDLREGFGLVAQAIGVSSPPAVIRRDDLAYILTALTIARPDLLEAFGLVAQAVGVSSPPIARVTVELPRRARSDNDKVF